jgi:hypothetical protein
MFYYSSVHHHIGGLEIFAASIIPAAFVHNV